MTGYLVDTSVIVGYLRGKDEAVNLLDSLAGELNSSYICLAELYEGIARAKNPDKAEEGLQTFFNSLSNIYTVDEAVANQFGRLRAHLKKQGKVIEDLDLLIAVTAIVHDLTLLTFNKKHFSHVENLKIA
jgi:predicted nucleic acid-binding protein